MPLSVDTNLLAFQERRSRDSSAEFQLTTQDGDTVTLRTRSSSSESFQASSAESESVKLYDFSASRSATDSVYLEVQGELDAAELEAFADLYAQVEALAGQFFAGDLDQALQQALTLEADFSEIASYSVNLSQTETAYRETVATNLSELPTAVSYRPLADAAGGMQSVLAAAREWLQEITGALDEAPRPEPPEPQQLVTQLLQPLLKEADVPVQQFADSLLAQLSD